MVTKFESYAHLSMYDYAESVLHISNILVQIIHMQPSGSVHCYGGRQAMRG